MILRNVSGWKQTIGEVQSHQSMNLLQIRKSMSKTICESVAKNSMGNCLEIRYMLSYSGWQFAMAKRVYDRTLEVVKTRAFNKKFSLID